MQLDLSKADKVLSALQELREKACRAYQFHPACQKRAAEAYKYRSYRSGKHHVKLLIIGVGFAQAIETSSRNHQGVEL